MTKLLAGFLFLLSPTAAFACPTVDDLGRGIEFRLANGDVEVHKQLRPDWVTLTVTYSDGDGVLMEMYRGLYLQSMVPMESGLPQLGLRDDFATQAELLQWQAPQPDASWANQTPGGGQAVAGSMDSTMIAGCRYASFEVVIEFNDDAGYKETYDYLPDLGLGLLVKTDADDESGVETYSYISIKPVE
ncbi:MAG: hypothetical protein AAF641_07605 [Pseudomonadota bacterium]